MTERAKSGRGLKGEGNFLPASKNRDRTRRLLVESRTPQKSFVFPFIRNLARAKSKKRTKLFCGGASDSERRRGGFLSSGIFDKVGSSAVVNILQD